LDFVIPYLVVSGTETYMFLAVAMGNDDLDRWGRRRRRKGRSLAEDRRACDDSDCR
jgi:hypothetical protein